MTPSLQCPNHFGVYASCIGCKLGDGTGDVQRCIALGHGNILHIYD